MSSKGTTAPIGNQTKGGGYGSQPIGEILNREGASRKLEVHRGLF